MTWLGSNQWPDWAQTNDLHLRQACINPMMLIQYIVATSYGIQFIINETFHLSQDIIIIWVLNWFFAYFSLCLNFFHLLARKPNLGNFSIYSKNFFHNFHLYKSSFTCPASGLRHRLLFCLRDLLRWVGLWLLNIHCNFNKYLKIIRI